MRQRTPPPPRVSEIVFDEHKLTIDSARRFGELVSVELDAAAYDYAGDPPRLLRLLIDCPGGKFAASCDIIDRIADPRAAGIGGEALIIGQCGSMAAVIAAACDRTFIVRDGSILWHGLSVTRFAGDYNALQERLALLKQQNARIVDILLARARRYRKRRDPRLVSRRELAKLMRSTDPIVFSPEDACRAGLVEAIVDSPAKAG